MIFYHGCFALIREKAGKDSTEDKFRHLLGVPPAHALKLTRLSQGPGYGRTPKIQTKPRARNGGKMKAEMAQNSIGNLCQSWVI
jgi:hypothetical protein